MTETFFLAFFYGAAEPSEGSGGYCMGGRVGAMRNGPTDVALMAFFFRCRQQLLGRGLPDSCVPSQAVGQIAGDTEHFVEAFRQSWHFRSFVTAKHSGRWDFRCADSLPIASNRIPEARFVVVAGNTEIRALGYLTVVLPLCTRDIRIVDHEPILGRQQGVIEGHFRKRGLEHFAIDANLHGVKPLFVKGRLA